MMTALTTIGGMIPLGTALTQSGAAGWLAAAALAWQAVEYGDFEALWLLRFYEVYRAMVRAKVHAIHAAERGLSRQERAELVADFRRQLRCAEAFSRPAPRGRWCSITWCMASITRAMRRCCCRPTFT